MTMLCEKQFAKGGSKRNNDIYTREVDEVVGHPRHVQNVVRKCFVNYGKYGKPYEQYLKTIDHGVPDENGAFRLWGPLPYLSPSCL